jgi:hypothetical protein
MSQPVKTCPNCDAPLVQRDNERDEAFDERVYCRRACHRQALRNGKQKLRQIRMTGEPGDW